MAGVEEVEEVEGQEEREVGHDLTRPRITRRALHLQKVLDEDEAHHIRHAVLPHLPDQTDDVVHDETGLLLDGQRRFHFSRVLEANIHAQKGSSCHNAMTSCIEFPLDSRLHEPGKTPTLPC